MQIEIDSKYAKDIILDLNLYEIYKKVHQI